MRAIIITMCILGCATLAFANWGFNRFGGDNFGSSKWGAGAPLVDTYWNTSYTDTGDWTTAYGAQWTEAYNTEIP